MSYYGAKGDFYGGGGYYRGDPGFLGGLLRTVAPIAASFIPGVGGLVAKGVTSLLGPGGGGGTPAAQSFAAPIATRQPTISAAGSASQITMSPSKSMRGRLSAAARAMPGMGGALPPVGAVQPGALPAHVRRPLGGRRRHRMNVCNPRALRRAIRRAHGFERIAKQVIGFSSPHRKTGRVYFKRKRRSRR